MKIPKILGIFIGLVLLVLLFILTTQTSAIAQHPAPVPRTGQTQSYASGDDGDLQKGVKWPDPRFTDNGDGTVTDNLTGLIWLKNADCFGIKTWDDALDVSNNLADGQCGLSEGSTPGDWRLPNVRELHSLIDYGNYDPALPTGHPFQNVQSGLYWSSTTAAKNTGYAWPVDIFSEFGTYFIVDKGAHYSVWPVRGGNAFQPLAEIIGTWSSGIWYWDVAASSWTQMYSGLPSAALAAGDFTGDGKADVASIWSSGLWFQNGDTLGWTQVYHTAPDRIAAGDINGDGVDEIIGCGGAWGDSGVWYRDVANGTWHHPWSGPPANTDKAACHPPNKTPDGPITAGDVTGDGKADMISCWDSGLWYQDGATLSWTKVWKTAPSEVTCGDITGDGQAEIIGPWSNGIWYRDVAESKWTKMYSFKPDVGIPVGNMATGDFTGDGKADVASCWKSGLWYQDGDTLGWTLVTSAAPYTVTAGDVLDVAKNPPNFSPVPRTGQTQSYASGDDGDLQKGVKWPDPRFTDNGDGTVTDNLTGLIWLKNADCFGIKTWDDALDVSNNLADGQCGLNDGSIPGDWRLPNVRELHSLIDYGNQEPALPSGHPFQYVYTGGVDWSSTTSAGMQAQGDAWFVLTWHHDTIGTQNKVNTESVWGSVRGGND